MDLQEATSRQQSGGGGVPSPGQANELNSLKKLLEDQKKKLENLNKQLQDKQKTVADLEAKLKVRLRVLLQHHFIFTWKWRNGLE